LFSLVIPVYRNEESIDALLAVLAGLCEAMAGDFEAVLVVDGSPDRCLERLRRALPTAPFSAQLITLSRNFGSFAAITAGLVHAQGPHFAVMAADLQEPPELILDFRKKLQEGDSDVIVGTRGRRADPWPNRILSGVFWWLYRHLVQREIPAGGVDVFACNQVFRDHLIALSERNTTLVGLIFWLGFRRGEVRYDRRPREAGQSAWSFSRRTRYLLDSAFAFSDLPIRLVSAAGLAGMALAVTLATLVLWARLHGGISVPGYAATVLTVMFFGGLNSLGIGLLGEYLWRTFENTKRRPGFVVAESRQFPGGGVKE